MFKKAIRCDTPATDNPGSSRFNHGILRIITVHYLYCLIESIIIRNAHPWMCDPGIRFKIKMNIEKLIGLYWKCDERNISQYISIQWKNIAIYRICFSCIVTPLWYPSCLFSSRGHQCLVNYCQYSSIIVVFVIAAICQKTLTLLFTFTNW